jgi:hypothetical protein
MVLLYIILVQSRHYSSMYEQRPSEFMQSGGIPVLDDLFSFHLSSKQLNIHIASSDMNKYWPASVLLHPSLDK